MSGELIIRGGRVVDPANDVDRVCDVHVKHGKVLRVGEHLEPSGDGCEYYDASGCLVTPGLIDAHIHAYRYCTPLGVDIDTYCLGRATTTAVDAGSSGAGTFAGLRKFIMEKSKTRLLAFLHIAAHGMAAAGCAGFGAGGECDSLNQIDETLCAQCIEENRDVIIGVKVRLTADVCDNGKNEMQAFRRALSVCKKVGLPLMTHHTFSSIPLDADQQEALGCPGSLRAGDFYTHTYHGYPSTVLDTDSLCILPAVLAARKRGVLYDVGHGQGSFTWTVAEHCARQGFFPDMITTDLHSGNVDGPVYDLPTTMSKLLHLGMPLCDVVRAVTAAPAAALRRTDIGSLSPGVDADISVLRLENVDLQLEDSQAQVRRMDRLLVPVAVWRAGHQHPITTLQIPNAAKLPALGQAWSHLVVRDEIPPL